jgi:DNA excision repair protein ERCC-2
MANADLVPSMQRVVQAAGRLSRTPKERGWLWLLDDRFRRGEVSELLSPWRRWAEIPQAHDAQTW